MNLCCSIDSLTLMQPVFDLDLDLITPAYAVADG